METPPGAKPDCYHCVYRAKLAHSAHSKCLHPLTAGVFKYPEAALVEQLGKRSGATYIPLDAAAASLQVEGHELGIRNGWFLWPLNFDPVWLTRCDGFTRRDTECAALT